MNHLRSILCGALGAMALTFAASTALADALPPDTEQCDPNAYPGHTPDPTKIGTACDISPGDPKTAKGTCHCSICTGLSYADAGPDAHGPTGTISFACLECKPGTQINCNQCPEPDAGASGTCEDTDAGPTGGDAGPVGDDAGLDDNMGDGSTGTKSSSSGGCSVGGSATAAAPWLLAAIVPVVFRRRRSKGDAKDAK